MLSRKLSRTQSAGMTLVELLIAVAIVGILAAIAYPSYQAQVRRSARTDAKAELLEAAQDLEKCFTRYGAYNSPNCNAYTRINTNNRLSENGKYRITFQNVQDPAIEYTMQASLVFGQPPDPECGFLTLDQSGQRNSSGNAPMNRCW